jgi:transposase-like protein
MARKNEARRAEMRGLIAEQETSGLSASRFARERGMSAWTLHNWKRRLREESTEVASRQAFVELQVADAAGPGLPIMVELATESRVLVPRGFEGEHLRR